MRNEVAAMRAAGHDVFVLAFHHGRLSAADRSANRDLASVFVASRRTSFTRATVRRPFLPYQVASRRGVADLDPVLAWEPQVIVCHHEWTLPVALRVRQTLGRTPIVLRAHNNELRYYRDLARSARGARAPYLFAEYLRIRRYLETARRYPVSEVWFMSPEDAGPTWAHVPSSVIPPVMFDAPLPDTAGEAERSSTVAFLGSLDVPHAVRGLEWFLGEVWPQVLARVPDATFTVAGRRPGPRVVRRVQRGHRVVLRPDPANPSEVLAGCRVFVNPVLAGSGVNLKLGEPMRRAVPIVTTSLGARGLDEVRDALGVADTPGDFARLCAALLSDDAEWRRAGQRLAELRGAYSADAVGKQLDAAVAALVGRGRTP
jgi:hypothetical protein